MTSSGVPAAEGWSSSLGALVLAAGTVGASETHAAAAEAPRAEATPAA